MKNRFASFICVLAALIISTQGCDKSEEVKAAAEVEKAQLEAEKAEAEAEAEAAKEEAEKAKAEAEATKAGAAAVVEEAKAKAKIAEEEKVKAEAEVEAGKAEVEAAVAEAEAIAAKAEAGKAEAEAGKAEAEAEAAEAEEAAAEAEEAAAEAEAGKVEAEEAAAEAEAGKVEAEEAAAEAEAGKAEAEAALEEMKQNVIDRAAVIGIMVQNKCLRDAKVKAAQMGTLQKEILKAFGMTAEQFNAKRASFKSDPDFRAAFTAGKNDCPEINPEHIQTEKQILAKKKYKAFMTGTLFGSAGGTISFRIVGKQATGKVVFKNGSKWNLKGTVKENRLRLYGEVGKTFYRTIATIDANGNRAAGTWHSFQGDKRRTGTFIATR